MRLKFLSFYFKYFGVFPPDSLECTAMLARYRRLLIERPEEAVPTRIRLARGGPTLSFTLPTNWSLNPQATPPVA